MELVIRLLSCRFEREVRKYLIDDEESLVYPWPNEPSEPRRIPMYGARRREANWNIDDRDPVIAFGSNPRETIGFRGASYLSWSFEGYLSRARPDFPVEDPHPPCETF